LFLTESSAYAKATADKQSAQSKKPILQILFILSKKTFRSFRVFRMLKIEVIEKEQLVSRRGVRLRQGYGGQAERAE